MADIFRLELNYHLKYNLKLEKGGHNSPFLWQNFFFLNSQLLYISFRAFTEGRVGLQLTRVTIMYVMVGTILSSNWIIEGIRVIAILVYQGSSCLFGKITGIVVFASITIRQTNSNLLL